MILSWEQALLAFQPLQADNYHWDLQQANPLFFNVIPFVEVPTAIIRRNYILQSDLPGDPIAQPLLLSDGGAPPIDITTLTAVPWATTRRGRQAQWWLTNLERPYAEDKNQSLFDQIEDLAVANVKANLYKMGLLLIRKFLEATVAPPASEVAGALANLNGFNNTTPAAAQGYSPTVFGNQVIVWNNTIFEFLGIGFPDNREVLNRAIRKVEGQPTAMIVPEAFVDAMERAYNRRGTVIPESMFTVMQRFPANPVIMALPTYKNIPVVVIHNDTYTAAGYTVSAPGANNYPVFFVRASTNTPFDGVCFAVNGKMIADNPEAVPAGADVVNLGTGIRLEKIGRIADKTGVYRFHGRTLSMNTQLVLGEPRCVSVVTGVQD